MNCRDVGTRLQALADDQIGPVHRREVEEHLETCSACAEAAHLAQQNVSFLVERLAHLRAAVTTDLSGLAAPAAAPARTGSGEVSADHRTNRKPLLIIALVLIIALAVAAFFLLRGDGAVPKPTDQGRAGAAKPKKTSRRQPGRAQNDRPKSTPETGSQPKSGSQPKPGPKPPAHPRKPGPPIKAGTPAPLGIAALLPVLAEQPTQRNLDRAWSALATNPGYAPRLIARVGSTEDSAIRAILVLVLGADNRSAATRKELFTLLAEDGAREVRIAAAAAMAWSAQDGALRIPTFRGLGIPVGPIEDQATLTELLTAAEAERDPQVVATLIRAVGPSEGPEGAVSSRLAELARSESEVVRDAALAALRASPPADSRVLLDLIEDAGLPLSSRAQLIGGLAGSREAVPLLSEIIRGAEEPELQVAAVGALGDCWDKYARIEILETLRNSTVPEVRRAAVGVLSKDPSADTLEVLRRIAEEDEDPGTRQEAKQATLELARILTPEPDSR